MKQYLDLLKQVLFEGEERSDRTGVGTLSVFGTQTRYDLREGFPLITTREIDMSVVVKELFWFLRGETNTKTLGAKIWDEWADKDGELGPIYGQQWREWREAGNLGGIDQISRLVDGLINDPYSRRHIVSAWNVSDLDAMKLQPCHVMFQVYVSREGMDLHLYQRSADLAIGVPFNIASYSLLLHMLARATGNRARYLIHSIGDAHIYKNHVQGVIEQLMREPRPLPSVNVVLYDQIWTSRVFKDPAVWTPEKVDVRLTGYKPHPKIKFPIAV